ncbi:hypothetical protein EGW08_021571 [Elysia chlorotica]|uniref:G-protein coupled receptors family 3 profile domain-containing protein n=1 Tax=Elysia chlorotica TaxID=188477 RepID=A0A433SN55_ELYCH|nr:hypothetical protein EGW08_021571 [Elysia chlorotica]
MAHGLHNMHQDLCPQGSKGLCPAMTPINGSLYLRYLLNVRFKSSEMKEEVYFDSKGDPPGRYEILNYQPKIQANGNTTYNYVTIGHWMNGSLLLNGHSIYWPRRSQGYSHSTGSFSSDCSDPCKPGEAKKVKGQACCWVCTKCVDNEILVDNNTDCRACALGMWPNLNKTDCLEIPIEFIDIGDTEAIVCVSLACLGMCATAWVAAIFARNHNTPIVKASTRELSYILLIGIALAFSSNFFIVSKPCREFCYIVRILPGLSFSLIYGALVTRTNRIARILEGSKRILTKKPKFMSASAQLVITGIIIGVECAVIVGMLLYQPPNSKLDYPSRQEVRLVCDTSTLGIVVPLGFDLVLILLCTIYAVKTRNLPENFNEAKFIGFTMYATCVIWMGFFPIYFAGEHKEVTLCICVSLSAAIALLLLFVPKVYIIVWVPEKNTRGAFTTSRDVRCHIGSKSMASVDSVDLRESSTFDSLFKSEKGLGKVWRQKSLDERRLRFVMQRTNTGSDSDTPYSNHGVLSASTAALLPQQSRDKSFSEPGSKMTGGHRKSLDSRVTYLDLPRDAREVQKSAVENLRKNLARDFPDHRRSPGVPPMRPGSPAEREKHKVKHNSMEHLVDLDTILRVSHGDEDRSQRKLGKLGEFRKSLSSSCVSTSAKTKSVECQTSEELVQYLLPTLRKRCVAKGKKLERSRAVVDEGLHQVRPTDTSTASLKQAPGAEPLKAVRVFNYPSVYHQKHALTIQKQPVMFLTLADHPKAGGESSSISNTRPKKNSDQNINGCTSYRDDSPQVSFIPDSRERCCQQHLRHYNQQCSHRRGRKYHSMVVPPSHMSGHVCKFHPQTYRFPTLYGFDELTPSCSSDTSCVDDTETAETAKSGRRPRSASPGHSVPLYTHGRAVENEQEPFLSPAHLPRDSRSRSAGYIPLQSCCAGEACPGVCWVESFATTCSPNDGSNVSTDSTTDSSSLIIPQFQSSMDSDGSQLSNEEEDDDDVEYNDNKDNIKDGLPEGLELYVTDPRTGGSVPGERFSQSIFTTTASGASMTNCQLTSREDKLDPSERVPGDPCGLVSNSQRSRDLPNQRKNTSSSCSVVDNSSCLLQLDSPKRSRFVDHSQVASEFPCESPDSSDMKEFQQLLQGHGVQIDLSRVQSSDL